MHDVTAILVLRTAHRQDLNMDMDARDKHFLNRGELT
jgi:hypothetical protein